MKKVITLAIVLCIIIIGIPLAIISVFNDENVVEEQSTSSQKVRVLITQTGEILEMDLETYIKGVVASEMPGEFELEALKAQAVAARTYAMSRMEMYADKGHPDHPTAPLCNGVHCQVYRSYEDIEALKSAEWMTQYWGKISEAVDETQGIIMTYQGELVNQPLFHSTSGGKTANSEDVFTTAVPYLRSVDSPYEEKAPHLQDTVSLSLDEFKSKTLSKYKNVSIDLNHIQDSVEILERSSGGRVSKIKVANLILSGRDVRETLGLRSANFTIKVNNDMITFNTVGYGHGVGMSQWGANGMAEKGYDYIQILKHYYQGIEIKKLQNDK